MKEKVEKYELIERFLNGDLHGSELEEFNSRVISDSQFSEEVLRHRRLNNLVEEVAYAGIKEKLGEIHSEQKFIKRKRIRYTRILVMSAVIGAITLLVVTRSNRLPLPENPMRVKADSGTYEADSVIRVPELEEIQIQNKISPIIEKAVEIEEQSVIPDKNLTESPVIDTVLPIETVVDSLKIPNSVPTLIKDSSKTEKTPEILPIVEDSCGNIKIEASIKTERSCDGKPTGQIIINPESVGGGAQPYAFSIDKQNFYANYNFKNLYSRMYCVSVKDNNGCITELGNYLIGSEDCSYEYAFAPDHNEIWEIPLNDKTGSIIIFNKYGKIVFEKAFDFPGGNEWNGRANNGTSLPMGVYPFILKYNEGGELLGNVTIIR